VATTPVPPPSGGTALTIRSNAEAWDSARRFTEYLEGLKNVEADQEGTHFPFTTSNLRSLFADSMIFFVL
jgi:hypothetical protein